MIRLLIALFCGALIGSMFNLGVIHLSNWWYPPPQDANLADAAVMNAYIAGLPWTAFLMILAAHAGGAFVGGLMAALIWGKRPWLLGTIIGGFFLLGGIVAALMITAPLWFVVIDLAAYIPCGILGAQLGTRARPSKSVARTVKGSGVNCAKHP